MYGGPRFYTKSAVCPECGVPPDDYWGAYIEGLVADELHEGQTIPIAESAPALKGNTYFELMNSCAGCLKNLSAVGYISRGKWVSTGNVKIAGRITLWR